MRLNLENPELRQLEIEYQFVNCRPSGLSGTNVKKKSPTVKKKTFSFSTITDITKDGAIKRWNVLSTGRRSVLIRYLFLKMIYDELTKEEMLLFQSFHETTTSVPIYFALKARYLGIPKKIVRKLLETISFEYFKIPSREEYQGLRKIHFQMEEKRYPPIKKPKPYSGYSKSFKDGKGHSKFTVVEYNSTPLEPSPNFEDTINFLIEFSFIAMSQPRKLGVNVSQIGEITNERRQT